MKYIRDLYLTRRFFTGIIILVFLFILAFVWPSLYVPVKLLFAVFTALVIADYGMLFFRKDAFFARRSLTKRLSNGDENPVTILLENHYGFAADLVIIDEIPHQFQRRDLLFRENTKAGTAKSLHYHIRPTQRGEYVFGNINVFISSPIGLIRRRFRFEDHKTVGVYPSFLNMRKYELLAISNRLTDIGLKKVRKIGHSQEFDQIRHYSTGDDIRSINWKATARRNEFMVNAYQDERSQQVYSLIDKGRLMEMPFEGLSLLDYSINAALVLSKVTLIRQDRAGLITFSKKVDQFVQAQKQNAHIQTILEVLYKQQTDFQESDFEKLYTRIRLGVSQRSLMVLFTNFETVNALQRQLPVLRKLNENHLLLVVFFENTELNKFISKPSENIREIYTKSVAEKYQYEKELIAAELKRYGIQALLTKPEDLTINTVNKYIEFKSRNLI